MADDRSTAPQEIELKFEIEPSGLLAVRALPAFAAAGPSPVLLTSTYWDTPAHDLARAGLTLRLRRDGAKRLQAIKSAEGSGLLGRGEWEDAIEGDTPDLTRIAATPLADLLTPRLAKRLVPLFTTRVRRTRRIIEQDSAVLELSLDEGEVVAGERKQSLLQLELELKSGAPSALFAAARPLLDLAPLRLSFVTKAASGFQLVEPEGKPTEASPLLLSAAQDAGGATQAILRAALGTLSGAIERMLRGTTPRSLHQTRVAARRLRAALAVAVDLGADPARDAVEAEVRWLAGELNTARDLDVFIEATLGPSEADPARAQAARELHAIIEQARTVAYARADEALRSERLRRMLFEATAWTASLGVAGPPALAFAGQVLDRRWRRVRKRAAALHGDDVDSQHRLRITVKKLRYAAEFLAALYDAGERRRFVNGLKRLQAALGELNDGAVAWTVAREALAGSENSSAALYAGERIGRRTTDTVRSLKQARKAWKRLESDGPFW